MSGKALVAPQWKRVWGVKHAHQSIKVHCVINVKRLIIVWMGNVSHVLIMQEGFGS